MGDWLVRGLWEVCAVVANFRFQGIVVLHDVLHGFREECWAGTATLEAKLIKHLARLAHDPLFRVFLYVCKVYDFLDKCFFLEILRVCGLGPNLACLLKNYWKRQSIFPKAGKCLGTSFETGRGVTQGNPAFSIIFNIVVYVVVREVLDVVCGPQEGQYGMDWVTVERNSVFYNNDISIAGQDHE